MLSTEYAHLSLLSQSEPKRLASADWTLTLLQNEIAWKRDDYHHCQWKSLDEAGRDIVADQLSGPTGRDHRD